MNISDRISVAIGSLFGIGFLPLMPGTWGSLATLPVVWLLLVYTGIPGVAFFTVLASIASWWSTAGFERYYGEDPGPLVMDEVAGQSLCLVLLLAFWGMNTEPALWVAAFIAFRFFDIVKWFGANAIQNFKGGFGVLADDLLAGIYAHLVVGLLIYFI